MLSGAAERQALLDSRNPTWELVRREKLFTRWTEHPSSSILHHHGACCDEARAWFLAYTRSMEIGHLSQFDVKAPTWLSQLFRWGPSRWPIAWCELVKEEVVDCGVFAALVREIFAAQGHPVHPAQALFSFSELCTSHWRDLWDWEGSKEDEYFPWVGKQIVYHELCALEMPGGEAKFYDSTWGHWLSHHPGQGFGALLALRVECPRLLSWNGNFFSCGEWVIL